MSPLTKSILNAMGDTRAINIILAGMIIVFIIAGFYLFLSTQTVEKHKAAIHGNAATLQADRLVSEWALENSAILHASPDGIADSLSAWLAKRGFTLRNTLGGKQTLTICNEHEGAVICRFTLSRTGTPNQPYEQTILVPEREGIRTIRLQGKVTYE